MDEPPELAQLGRPAGDDPMNLTKYFMTSMPWDNTIGTADFPSIWNLGLREGKSLNWGGERPLRGRSLSIQPWGCRRTRRQWSRTPPGSRISW